MRGEKQSQSDKFPPANGQNNNEQSTDAPTRFQPVGLETVKTRRKLSWPRLGKRGSRWLDWFGWTLEALVVLLLVVLLGNWVLQQFGISVDLFRAGPAVSTAIAPMQADGPVLYAQARGVIAVPPTATPLPTATPKPTERPIIGTSPTARPTATPVQLATPLPPGPTPVIAPTPVIVQSAPAPIARAKYGPPTRLIIPKIGVDTPVAEVIVNLGNWQVADYAAGHHQGTANAGDSSNMVIAGHRDARGSVFLRLNELQPGDEFKVQSAISSYRYVVTKIFEVAPTDVYVMQPTTEGTATLITCTPIGIDTSRLIVQAKLVP